MLKELKEYPRHLYHEILSSIIVHTPEEELAANGYRRTPYPIPPVVEAKPVDPLAALTARVEALEAASEKGRKR